MRKRNDELRGDDEIVSIALKIKGSDYNKIKAYLFSNLDKNMNPKSIQTFINELITAKLRRMK
jgi:hypothetical protein